MVTGIIGRKLGMTQIFDQDGTVHPATVIKGAGPGATGGLLLVRKSVKLSKAQQHAAKKA